MTLADDASRLAAEESAPAEPLTAAPQQPHSRPWWSWLAAETGQGNLQDYLNDPINVTGTAWNAQIARGVAGLLGHQRLAMVDIIIGGIRGWLGTRKG